ncbi:hypothetical protein HK098_003553 [Nowakowskiella sp. JEL0407]|nr:hypothetical protein HK098_003553 [Nowakowskiella sp. JEL0407]
MATADLKQLLWGVPIACHAFNKDKSKLAISPNSNDVQIWALNNGNWELEHTLSQHDKLITGIDWAPNSNQIVSCSQDRNAYVWQFEYGVWKPTMVLLRINRAATCVKWSPKENKFAVGTGSKLIAVCYFDDDEMIQSWVSKHIKKHITSTVLSIDWHPEGILIACGGTDMKTRVFSAWIKGIDPKVSSPVWAEKLPFEHLCKEYNNGFGGWVHSVSFSPSGDSVAWTGHDASVSIASPAEDKVFTVPTKLLPFTSLTFLSETSIVAVGHDCVPFLFSRRGNNWELVDKLDQGIKKKISTNSAMDKFRQMDSRAQSGNDSEINSQHQNTILSVLPYGGTRDQVTSFSTVGVDGKLLILNNAGKDATDSYNSFHPPSLIDTHLQNCKVGVLESPGSFETKIENVFPLNKPANDLLPPLETLLNIYDFGIAAKSALNEEAFSYVCSGAMDEITLRENMEAFRKIWLRPRVMVDVEEVDTSCTILGHKSSLPIFISSAAMGKLMHPRGEVVLATASGQNNIIQMIPTLSSCSLEEITSARLDNQVQFFQLYVHSDREHTLKLIKNAEKTGCKAICITVDCPVLGNRENHTRAKQRHNSNVHAMLNTEKSPKNVSHQKKSSSKSFMTHDASLNWKDLAWFKSNTSLPIVLKGIQRGDDAVLAAKHGCEGIIVSNHGGRQLDCTRPAISILSEVMRDLRVYGLDKKIEVYMDGGVRRGTDIIKALAMGAKAVGLGRPFLHAMMYGVDGVDRLVEIIREEVELGMRLCGVSRIDEIGEWLILDEKAKL